MKNYDHKKIEANWQRAWDRKKLYQVPDAERGGENFYTLVEFPYPSGNLHVGHWYAFCVPDIFTRFKRMQGKNMLFPIGFDAFGLPAENAAIKRGVNPKKWTYDNIVYMRKQLRTMGASFDWSREVITCDPEYYKWTQWIFLQFFNAGLAYQAETNVNWCPKDKTVLANEQVIAGRCERCDSIVEQRKMKQWMLKITDYAEKLLKGLEKLDWPEEIKESQRNWIGRSEGALIKFEINPKSQNPNHKQGVEVFTTRADTIFGATYLVLAPEHEKIKNLESRIQNSEEVRKYVEKAKRKTELERIAEAKEKTGMELKGIKAINPATNEEIPVWVADYVLATYGTGAIMAVPAHDERDWEFAKKYGLPVREVVRSSGSNCILIHGCPSKPRPDRPFEQNWRLWVKKELEKRRVETFTPQMPEAWNPKYTAWKKEFEKLPISSESVLVGASCGAAFIVRWLGESKVRIKKLILVAPAKTAKSGDKSKEDLYDFEINPTIKERVAESVVFISNDEERHLKAAKLYEKFLNARSIELKNKGHFTFQEMGTNEFPEVLKEILTVGGESIANAYTGEGVIVNSGKFNGMDSERAKMGITRFVNGVKKVQYKLRDWVISRQRYWGVPIPVIRCSDCGIKAVPGKDLPVKLPEIKDYKPKGDGKSPLAKVEKWVKTKCPKCGQDAERETDTMDTFVDSSWYFLRYTDPKNKKKFADEAKMRAWMPVDRYSGGAEHTTMHLLYSRFWIRAMHDLGLVEWNEPYIKRLNRGLILGPDGQKMSKSKGNVVDPDHYVSRLGADTVRMYLAFIGPYNEVGAYPWNPKGIMGVRRFLEKAWRFSHVLTLNKVKGKDIRGSSSRSASQNDSNVEGLLHKTIKKITEDIDAFKFNTAVSAMMILLNEMGIRKQELGMRGLETFLKLLAPFAPHLAEELWQEALGHKTSIHLEKWPEYDAKLTKEDVINLPVQINGRLRAVIRVEVHASEDEVKKLALADENIRKYLAGKVAKTVIYVKGKIINLVIT